MSTSKKHYDVVTINNPLDRFGSRVFDTAPYAGESLAEIKAGRIPAAMMVAVSLNGRIIADDQLADTYLKDGDNILFMAQLAGDDALRVVLALAVVVVSIVSYGYLTGPAVGWGSTAAGLVAAGISIGGGLLINTLFPVSSPAVSQLDDSSRSQWFAWSPKTTQQQGLPWPKYYGVNKVHGNVIETYTATPWRSQILNVLIQLGLGPIYPLTDMRINDQPVENLKDNAAIETRWGELYQTAIPTFSNTVDEDVVNSLVDYEAEVIRQTGQADYDGLYVHVAAPGGMYYANDDGGMDPYGVLIKIEAKPAAGTWALDAIQLARHKMSAGANLDPGSTGVWTFGQWIPAYQTTKNKVWYRAGHVDEGNTDPTAYHNGAVDFDTDPCCKWQWVSATTTNWNYTDSFVDGVWFGSWAGNVNAPIFLKSLFFNIGSDNHGLYDTRVTNTYSEPAAAARYADAVYFSKIQGLYFDAFEYPRQVLVAVSALATSELSGGFDFSCKTGGTIVRVYNGSTWTSTFSKNPAWVCWDVLTQPVLDNEDSYAVIRYDGLDPSYLDEDSFKDWADFCDVLVTDADGTPANEKRHLFDGGFDTGGTLWDHALRICAAARAAPIWTGSKLRIVLNQTSSSTYVYSQGNIVADSLEISYIPQEERAGQIEVDFKNADKNYEKDTLTVVNASAGNRTKTAKLELVGPTRPSEVWRAGALQLYQNQYCKKAISFDVEIEALASEIGDVISIQHDIMDLDDAKSGRVVSAADASTVTIDTGVTIDGGETYQLIIKFSDDTVETRTVSTGAGSGITTLAVSAPFTSTPSKYDTYAFGRTSEVVQEYRITALDLTSDQRISVKAVQYTDSIYAMDAATPNVPVDPYDPYDPVYPVTNLSAIDVSTYDPKAAALNRHIVVTWDIPENGTYFKAEVYIREAAEDGEAWEYLGYSETNFLQKRDLSWTVDYEVLVQTVNLKGAKLPWDSCPRTTVTAVSVTPTPALNPNVENLRIRGETPGDAGWQEPDLHLEWDHMNTVILGIFTERKDYKIEICEDDDTVRRTVYPEDNYFTYTQAMNIADGIEGTIRVKVWARDTGDRLSYTEAEILCTNAVPANVANLVATSYMGAVKFTWDENSENDLSHYVYRLGIHATAATPAGAWLPTKKTNVLRTLTPTEKDTYGVDANIAIEVKAVDTLGLTSTTAQSANADCGSLNIQPTDIDDFAVTASKLFTKIPILSGDAWTDDSPDTDSVAWNEHTLYFNGVAYTITAGNTNTKYIYWDLNDAPTTYHGTNTHPGDAVLDDEAFIIATNIAGAHDLAWNAIANQVVGSAFIQDLAVGSAHIEDLAVTNAKINDLDGVKITARTILGGSISLETKISINDDTFGNEGIQLDYNTGTPRIYIGDGADDYMSFTSGAGLEISTSKATGIKIKSGGDLEVQDGGDILVKDGGDLVLSSLAASGDWDAITFVKQDDSTTYGKLTFSAAATRNLQLGTINGATLTLYTLGGGNISLNAGVAGANHILISASKLKIGTGTPVYKLDVLSNHASGFAARFFNDGNSTNRYGIVVQSGTDNNSGTNHHIAFRDGDGTDVGYITSTGGTVSYGAFTAHHPARIPPQYNAAGLPYGTLMRIVRVLAADLAKHDRSIIYDAVPTTQPNDPRLLGAYAGKFDHLPNMHSIYVLGDGHILCCNEGGNLSVGDPITSSSKVGRGMKATTACMIIAIAQEDYQFVDENDTKRIAVQYGLRHYHPEV